MKKITIIVVVIILLIVGGVWIVIQYGCKIPIVKRLFDCPTEVVLNEEPEPTPEPSSTPAPTATSKPEYAIEEEMKYLDVEEAKTQDPALEAFLQDLKRALEEADFEILETMISDPFLVGRYQTSFVFYGREEAIENLKTWVQPGQIRMDISNIGRDTAEGLDAKLLEGKYFILSEGWPGRSLLGIAVTDGKYFWSELITKIN